MKDEILSTIKKLSKKKVAGFKYKKGMDDMNEKELKTVYKNMAIFQEIMRNGNTSSVELKKLSIKELKDLYRKIYKKQIRFNDLYEKSDNVSVK